MEKTKEKKQLLFYETLMKYHLGHEQRLQIIQRKKTFFRFPLFSNLINVAGNLWKFFSPNEPPFIKESNTVKKKKIAL